MASREKSRLFTNQAGAAVSSQSMPTPRGLALEVRDHITLATPLNRVSKLTLAKRLDGHNTNQLTNSSDQVRPNSSSVHVVSQACSMFKGWLEDMHRPKTYDGTQERLLARQFGNDMSHHK